MLQRHILLNHIPPGKFKRKTCQVPYGCVSKTNIWLMSFLNVYWIQVYRHKRKSIHRHSSMAPGMWFPVEIPCVASVFVHSLGISVGLSHPPASVLLSLPRFHLPPGTLNNNYQNLLLENAGLDGEGCKTMGSRDIWSSILNTTLVTPCYHTIAPAVELLGNYFPKTAL